MIVVDSSVWIDYFKGADSPEVNLLDRLVGEQPLVVGDLILVEVLQGFRSDADCTAAAAALHAFDVVTILGPELAIRAAQNYRTLRKQGVIVRKTIDVIIATYCIERDAALLFTDRDYHPFVEHLGLRVA